MFGMKSANFYKLQDIIENCKAKQDDRITVSKQNTLLINGIDLITHLKQNAPEGKLEYIKGETEFIYGFGDKIG